MRFSGSITALVTPFDGRAVDEAALRRLVRFQLLNGTAGLVPCGSTGEAATLHINEYRRVVEVVADEAAGRVPVIAGVGSNDTEKAVVLAKAARDAGADALLVLVPYYNKPTQEGMYRHFGAVAKAVPLPTVAYNIPGRTAVNMAAATLVRIAAAFPNVVAVKEASGSLDQVSETLALAPKGFTVLSGDDSLTVPMMAIGAKGVISVLSNVAPKESAKMVAAALAGDFKAAAAWHLRLLPAMKALFVETNPIPVKAAAEMLGFGSAEPRLPLTPATAATRAALKAAFKKAGLRL
jgi:4-hydroxy-tetrahydrodipicolinate synthase